MKDEMTKILQECINLLALYYNRDFGERYLDQTDKLKSVYSQFINENNKKEFFDLLYSCTHDDREFYIIIMSVLYNAISEPKIIDEIIKVLNNEEFDVYSSLIIAQQIYHTLFVNKSLEVDYIKLRAMYEKILERFEKKLKVKSEYIPVKERNPDKVIIVTKQLIGDLHAPSRIVKEISTALQNEFGMEVFVIIALEEVDKIRCEQLWIDPFIFNYFEENNGNFLLEYKNKKISGYQFIIREENENLLKLLINEIQEMKPLFVFSIGDTIPVADIMRKFTHVVAESLSVTLPVSVAQILINVNKNLRNDFAFEYIKSQKQVVIDNEVVFYADDAKNTYTRDRFQVPADAFAIAIVGNRLDSEITDDFIGLLKQLLDCNKKIFYVFIGEFITFSEKIKDSALKERTVCVGFQEDLPALYNIMDLYLNPPRQGGGFSALSAIYHGVPVVTLKDCDVAHDIDEEFSCESIADIIKTVERYITDEIFYNNRRQAGINSAHRKSNFKSNINAILQEVNKEN